MRQRTMVFGLIFLSIMLVIIPVARPSAAGFTIDYPGAIVTWPLGVNNSGTVVGYYADNAGIHGFVFQGAGATGRFTSVDVPGSIQTELHGINNRGVTVGVYWDSAGNQHGFMHRGRDFTKGYTTINVSFADCCTSALGINTRGDIVGTYWASNGLHGFVHRGKNFTKGYTTVDVAGAYETTPSGINASGEIVGKYHDATYQLHGFAVIRGVMTTLDVSSATVPAPLPGTTEASGINRSGAIVGDYLDTAYTFDGFVSQRTSFAPFTYNNAMVTFPKGISDKGEIVGIEYDGGTTFHGFAMGAPVSSGSGDEDRGDGDNGQGGDQDGDQGGDHE